ncbi:protein of unknown function [Nitrosospira briensis]|uniref:eCIS core domain-containing protein n=1 Tax=Nitrosospira briensis TaxID=35799 RepID=A0A1I4Y5G8_9PROT|nr:DUF4157 domain-containing protein [Nitrosospira briensis]SFN33322.1 protein of unknown function [Nitrosospira briensis]
MTQLSSQTQKSHAKIDPLPASGFLQRKYACGNYRVGRDHCTDCGEKEQSTQREVANTAKPDGYVIQRKLTIGASDDPSEKEADRVADQVMSMPANAAINRAPLRIQRLTGSPTEAVTEAPPSVDRVLSSPGKPLEPELRRDMEQRFGYDFSLVRVHTDLTAEQSTKDMNANAYTMGHNIVFGARQFLPNTHEGRRLIAHELTHALQQEGSVDTQKIRSQDNPASALIQYLSPSPITPSPVRRQIASQGQATSSSTPCNSTDDGVIQSAISTAEPWVPPSLRWLGEYQDMLNSLARSLTPGTSRPIGPEIFRRLQLLEDHFRISVKVRSLRGIFPASEADRVTVQDCQTLGQVVDNIRRHFRDLDLDELSYDCSTVPRRSTHAGDVWGSAVPGSRHFTIYTGAFNPLDGSVSAQTQAGVVLHEAFHAMFSEFHGDSYYFDTDYPGRRPEANADSYANFASILATGAPIGRIGPAIRIQGSTGTTP